jgi:hypothetical protein
LAKPALPVSSLTPALDVASRSHLLAETGLSITFRAVSLLAITTLPGSGLAEALTCLAVLAVHPAAFSPATHSKATLAIATLAVALAIAALTITARLIPLLLSVAALIPLSLLAVTAAVPFIQIAIAEVLCHVATPLYTYSDLDLPVISTSPIMPC